MTNLEIVIIGIAPMVTLFVGIVGGLLFDRSKLAELTKMWRSRYQKEKKTSSALESAQAEMEQEHSAKLEKIKKNQGKQFKLGVDAFLENCRTRALKQLAKNEKLNEADEFYLSSLKMYSSSLEATLSTLNAEQPMKFQELLGPLRAQVVETVSSGAGPSPGAPVFNRFQKTFREQEVSRIKLRGLIEEVYSGGKVVMKEKKDELVLDLEKQLRDRIAQQQEMLIQLRQMEEELGAIKSPEMKQFS